MRIGGGEVNARFTHLCAEQLDVANESVITARSGLTESRRGGVELIVEGFHL